MKKRLSISTILIQLLIHYKIVLKRLDLKKLDYLESNKTVWIKLTQAKVISNKRLLRKIDMISTDEFINIVEAFKNSL